MAGKNTRHLVKKELDKASGNLEWVMKHLVKVRNLCHEGNREDLVTMIDKLGETTLQLQTLIDGFQQGVDGEIKLK